MCQRNSIPNKLLAVILQSTVYVGYRQGRTWREDLHPGAEVTRPRQPAQTSRYRILLA